VNTASVYSNAIKPPLTELDIELKAKALENKQLKESQDRLERDQWLAHSFTIKLLKDLALMAKVLTEQSENLSIQMPNSPKIQVNSVISKTLKEAINYARTGQQTIVNGQTSSNDLA
jgi:hypothetical protein